MLLKTGFMPWAHASGKGDSDRDLDVLTDSGNLQGRKGTRYGEVTKERGGSRSVTINWRDRRRAGWRDNRSANGITIDCIAGVEKCPHLCERARVGREDGSRHRERSAPGAWGENSAVGKRCAAVPRRIVPHLAKVESRPRRGRCNDSTSVVAGDAIDLNAVIAGYVVSSKQSNQESVPAGADSERVFKIAMIGNCAIGIPDIDGR